MNRDHRAERAPLVALAHGSERRDRGSITAFVVTMTIGLIACAGLVFDGGRLLGARLEAADHAENAARVGAQHVMAVRDGEWHLDPSEARRVALAYLSSVGIQGDVAIVGEEISVTAVVERDMTLLSVVGVGHRSVSATRTARSVDR
ncbi:MAG: pilus assembly protein TadG-related protein [Acidimicrobiia bacterium]